MFCLLSFFDGFCHHAYMFDIRTLRYPSKVRLGWNFASSYSKKSSSLEEDSYNHLPNYELKPGNCLGKSSKMEIYLIGR